MIEVDLVSFLMALLIAILMGASIFLCTHEKLWKKIVGVALLGNAINLFIVVVSFRPYDVGGQEIMNLSAFSRPAFIQGASKKLALSLSDPIAQALVLTAIVIGFAVLCLLLMLYLSHYPKGEGEKTQ